MEISSLSGHIRKLRKKSGLSLSELAKRANTSVPALCRYETGWERFEFYTLDKIASALGFSLHISFKSLDPASFSKNPSDVIKKIKRLFWDHRLKKSDLGKYPVWITERVIEYGNLDEVRILTNYFGKKVFLGHVSNCRFNSSKTKVFWEAILEKEGIECTKRPFRREAKNY